MTGRDDDPISRAGGIIPADEELRRCVYEAFADPQPSILAREVFAQLRARHAERVTAEQKNPDIGVP